MVKVDTVSIGAAVTILLASVVEYGRYPCPHELTLTS